MLTVREDAEVLFGGRRLAINMNSRSILLTSLAVLAGAGGLVAAPQKGTVEKRSYDFEEAGKEMEYRLYVPTSYKKAVKTPLVVLLHGLGSNPSQVIRYSGITAEAEKRGFIVVAPFGYNERGWYGSRGKGKEGSYFGQPGDPDNLGELSEKDVLKVLEIVRTEFNINEHRIYLMGHSMGGGGTVNLGFTHPKIWAALAPLAPALQGSPSVLEKIKVPIMVVTGEQDRLVQVGTVRRWVEHMKELKMTHVYKEIAGGNHFGTITNNPEMIGEVFEFFDTYQRPEARKLPEPYREFTNQAGKTIHAKPVTVTAGKVTIERKDGKVFTLPLTSLSEADQEFLKEWAGRQ